MEQSQLKTTAIRLSEVRARLLEKQPFFGRLLMRLPFGFSDCGTAYTDMRRIVFDPAFASRLKDDELEFVLLHELLHCVLKHCTRGAGKLHYLYNVACDIVVNSVILDATGKKEMLIDGTPAMHLAPNQKEGRRYSAEEIYRMLMDEAKKKPNTNQARISFDLHDPWASVFSDSLLEEEWNKTIVTVAKSAGFGSGIPEGLRRLINRIHRSSKINWQQILHDFIQHDKNDYVFSIPDKRFSGDIIMPSFQEEVSGSKVENIWFAIDTSGSVSKEALTETFNELNDAIHQIENLRGSISFFDYKVTEPLPFESVEDLLSLTPTGGGGTSYENVFRFMKNQFKEELPEAVIVMTDGDCQFPDERIAMGTHVIWIITDHSVTPPWGDCIYVPI